MPEQHDVRLKTLETQVACAADQNLLDAFLRANTWLPHGCSQGTCGSCKMQVLEGEIDHRASSEFILTPTPGRRPSRGRRRSRPR